MRALITGTSGFVGSQLLLKMHCSGLPIKVRSALRLRPKNLDDDYEVVGNIGPFTDWTNALSGIDVVIHLAARVHVMRDSSANPLTEYRLVNVEGTLNLARQAAAAGVRRFIFLSSIKVNGEETVDGEAFTEISAPHPVDPYGISKYEAEEGLRTICEKAGMEYVIIRPPLIYGPGVKANYHKLIQAVKKGYPLPFGCVENKRSMLALGNLIDFIILVLTDRRAANQIFLLSDGQDLSSKELVKNIAIALGVAPRILPVPLFFLKILGILLGKRVLIKRLVGSLQIDSRKARELLKWTPPLEIKEGIFMAIHEKNE
jgi:nucleoside-diphosphate-sugar epimerase